MLAFKWLGWITGHRIKTPSFLACFGVKGGQIAAHNIFGTRRPDQHLALHDARRARDGHGRSLGNGQLIPQDFASIGIEGDEPPVERGDIDTPFIHGDAAIDGVTAHIDQFGTGHLRVIFPHFLARRGIIGLHHRPSGRDIHDAIDDNRGGFLPTGGVHIGRPSQAQLADILIAHLRQR